jgi:hypothetical protein
MRVRQILLAMAGVILLLGTGLAGTSGAAGSVTVTPKPVPVTSNQTDATVTVNWTGQPANTLMFVSVCGKSIADATFNVALDCSSLSLLTPNGTATGSGSVQLNVFRGENPDGDSGWGCFAPGDPALPGVTKNTTCYVRVTNNSNNNKLDAVETSFTFQVGGDVIPEAPLSILLPVVGGAVALGAFFYLRRRSTPTPA